MALNWQNNGETVNLINDGSILSHPSADIKGGDLVLVGADAANVVLKGVAMTDIVLAANVTEFKYNDGSVCRIGEWLFNGILNAAGSQFDKLNYNITDKIFTDDNTSGKIAVAAISMVDPQVEPKKLIDASGKVDLATFAAAGDGSLIVNEVFEITITKSSDLGAGTPVKAEYSIVGNNTHTTPATGVFDAAQADIFGDVNTINLQLDHVAGVDLYEGMKFYIATLGDNSGVVADAGMLTQAAIAGPHMAVPTSTVDKGLNQDEGPQGNVGKLNVIINI